MIEFIVHADDFGISESVNACIDHCLTKGWVSEMSLMVNMSACEQALELARKGNYSHLVGLHLNLTEGFPLTGPIKKCTRFCNKNGEFNCLFHIVQKSRFFLSRQEREAVRIEIEAQLQRFCSYSGLMKRIDSHHHVHTDWAIYRILKPLAIKYGFSGVRLSADLHRVRIDKALYKSILNRDIRKYFETTDHFDGLGAVVQSSARGRIEVMTHPLLKGGILCDTATPFEEQIQRLRAISNSTIRTFETAKSKGSL